MPQVSPRPQVALPEPGVPRVSARPRGPLLEPVSPHGFPLQRSWALAWNPLDGWRLSLRSGGSSPDGWPRHDWLLGGSRLDGLLLCDSRLDGLPPHGSRAPRLSPEEPKLALLSATSSERDKFPPQLWRRLLPFR